MQNPEFFKLNPNPEFLGVGNSTPSFFFSRRILHPNPKSRFFQTQSQIPNFSKSIPIPIPNPEFFKLNPKSQSQIPNFSISIPIPIPNPKFFKINPKSQIVIGIGIWSGSLGFESQMSTSDNVVIERKSY